eukprot:111138-Pyramimonas_sp.AAC.1
MTRDEDVVVMTRLVARMRAVAAVPGMAATVAANTTGASGAIMVATSMTTLQVAAVMTNATD